MDEAVVGVVGVLVTVVTSIATLAYWMGKKFQRLESEVKTVKEELRDKTNSLLLGFQSYQEFFIELLASEGMLRAERVQLAKNELLRIIKIVRANPLTKEEVERLEELLRKDELTLEEALELREIARKVVREYGNYVEAWKLHAYASLMVGLAMSKKKAG
ncbi:MAG: hypothetical protein QW247_06195 [Pyrobaculum sp.]